MTRNELEFSIFCIENLAERLDVGGEVVYRLLTRNNGKGSLLDAYIVPNYAALHSQGKEYIVNDLIEIMKRENLLNKEGLPE
ncbi:MAG: DUF3791 domain-containing protein [Puniceicoccales bacterium]|nr:DUF3791 domain-containing protein [Puniceicoccales bacterium]